MPICPLPPEQLIQRLLPTINPHPADRRQAWNDWYQAGGAAPVLKFIRWANGTATEDDEILQETLITAYHKIEAGQYEDRALPFTAYLKKIAHYKIMEAARRGSRWVGLDDLDEHPAGQIAAEPPPEIEGIERWREQAALTAALADLPPRRRRIILLYEHGYSTAEIAAHYDIREELVRKEKSLGLRQLRQTLAAQAAAYEPLSA